MTRRDCPNRRIATQQWRTTLSGRPLLVAAELLAASLVALPRDAWADDLPAPPAVARPAPAKPQAPDQPLDGQAAPRPITREEIATLMPLIVTLPEHKRLAARLLPLVQKGDLETAERNLDNAIEVGTLATILADWLHQPGFLTALQALPLPPEAASETADAPVPAADARVAEMQNALDRERAQSEASARELADVTEQLKALKSRHESELAAASAKAADLQKVLDGQQADAEKTTRDLALMTEQFNSLKAASASDKAAAASQVAAVQAALDRQREQAELSARDLAAVTDQFQSLKSLRDREAAAANDTAASLQKALEDQRAQAAAARQELAAATEDLRKVEAQWHRESSESAAAIADLRTAVSHEREARGAIVVQLSDTLEELRSLRGIKEAGSTPLIYRLEMLGVRSPLNLRSAAGLLTAGPLVETAAIEQTSSIAAAAAPEPDVDAAPAPPPTRATILTARIIPPSPGSGPDAPPSPDDRLTQRGEALFRQGDISGARLVLIRAHEAGSARAAYLLGETFDPNVLSEQRVIGIRSDKAKARDLYGKALSGGIGEARARLDALK